MQSIASCSISSLTLINAPKAEATMDLKLAGKDVLITGGSRGIGYACAEVFAQEGCRVTIVGSKPASVEQARSACRQPTVRLSTVCASTWARSEGIESLAERLQAVDILGQQRRRDSRRGAR